MDQMTGALVLTPRAKCMANPRVSFCTALLKRAISRGWQDYIHVLHAVFSLQLLLFKDYPSTWVYYGSMVMTLCWANSSLTAFACQGFVDPNQECDWGYKACCLANYQIELQPFCSLATYHKNKAAAINNKDLFRLSLARLLARQCEK